MQFIIEWNEDHQCFTDEMGMPTSLKELQHLQRLLVKGMQRTPAELAGLAKQTLTERNPHMARRLEQSDDYTAERFA